MSRETRSVTALRAFFGRADTSPAGVSPPPPVLAPVGEILLTAGQKQALLKLRGSETAKAVLDELRKRGEFVATSRDLCALEHLGMVINKGSFHVINPTARWKVDRIVHGCARELKLHILTFNYSRNGFVRCSCGFCRHVSAYGTDQVMALGRAGERHQLEVSVKQMDTGGAR